MSVIREVRTGIPQSAPKRSLIRRCHDLRFYQHSPSGYEGQVGLFYRTGPCRSPAHKRGPGRSGRDECPLSSPPLGSEIILCPWIACVSRCALIPSCPRYLPVAPTSRTMPRVGLVRLKVRLCQGTDRPQHSDDEQNDAHDRLSWLFQLLVRGLRCFDTNALCILSIINKAIKSLRSKEFTKRVSFQADF
jgi:hypothetical protein